MEQYLKSVLTKYLEIRDQIKHEKPQEWLQVIELCKKVPKSIDRQALWMSGRDKPCWSNITVAGGARIAQDLGMSADFSSFEIIASDSWKIVKTGKGRGNSNFEFIGEAAKRFLKSLNRGGLSSYQWKLFSIRELALALNGGGDKIESLVNTLVSKNILSLEEIEPWTKAFAKCAGFGWGYITANHMVADLGVSIKPDIHVRRSGVRLGMAGDTSPHLTDKEIDDLPGKVDFEIVRTAIQLPKLIEPIALEGATGAFKNKIALREMDKVLMEWSRQGLSKPV